MGFLDDLLRGAQEVATRAYNQANPLDGGKNFLTPVNRPAPRPQQRPQPQYSPQVQQARAAIYSPAAIAGDIGRAAQGFGQGVADMATGTINNLGNRVADFGQAGAEVIREVSGQNQADYERKQKQAAEYRRMAEGFAKRAQMEQDPGRREVYINQIKSLAVAESNALNQNAEDISRGLNATDPRKTLTNAAETALDVATAGRGSALLHGLQPAATQVTKETLKTLGKNAARTGAEGAGLGAAYTGVDTARDSSATLQDYARNMGQGALLGGAVGLGAQAALPVAGAALRGGAKQVKGMVDLHNNMTPAQRQGGFIAGPGAKGFADAQKAGRVFDGVDGKKRFEVDDSKSKIIDDYFDERQLQDVLDHPELYRNYPELRNLSVFENKNLSKDVNAQFNPDGSIGVNSKLLRNPEKLRSEILHEIQHKIQSQEGFATGGSVASIDDGRLAAVESQIKENIDGLKRIPLSEIDKRKQVARYIQSLQDERNAITVQPLQDYRNLAGEAEARAVQARMNMTDGERYVQRPDNILFHGSKNDSISKFDVNASRVTGRKDEALGRGVYLSDNPSTSRAYGNNIYTVETKQGLKYIDLDSHNQWANDAQIEQLAQKLNDSGFKVEHRGNGLIGSNDGLIDGNQPKSILRWLKAQSFDRPGEVESILDSLGFHGFKSGDAKTVFNSNNAAIKTVSKNLSREEAKSLSKPRSTFYDSLDVPKKDLIVRNGDGVAMSIDPTAAKTTPKKALPQAGSPEPSIAKFQKSSKQSSSTTQLNTNRLDLTDEAKARLSSDTQAVVERLTNEQVKDMAKSAGIDFKSYGVEGTKKKIAEQLNLRNEITTVEKQIQAARAAGNTEEVANLMKQSADLGRLSREQGTDLGRQLAARRIIADQLATPQQKLFRLFDEAGVDPDAYTKKMANVDMNNADEVIKAYRELVPATAADWLDKYRYTNMLSAPLTHLVNLASNAQGLAGVAPAQKLYEGTVDAVRAGLTGGPRTRYASEAGSYYKGAAKAVPEAMKKFADVVTGKQLMDMPDADSLKYGKLAHGGIKGAADNILSVIPKFLEASDQMFMTLARGGERAAFANRQAKGVQMKGDIEGLIDDSAKYRVFRQDLGKPGQGALLEMIDFIPNQLLLAGRRSKNPIVSTVTKFTVPFVTTPVNLFKQGIEYSPAGVLTLAGNADKTAQVAKALMGTTAITIAASALAGDDRITFNEPSDPKQRDAFRAEGKQPYAVKIGDKWFGYSKLHPAIAFNLAVVAATKQGIDMGAIDQPTSDKILNAAGGVMGYFRDQSYMKGVGDFTSNLELKDGASMEDAVASMGSSWANQLVPFKGMVSWIGRQIDPTQRKIDYSAGAPEQIYQSMVKDIPGLNKDVPVRENPYYKDSVEPILNDNPTLNAFSPVRVTNDKGYGNTTGLNVTQRREQAKLSDAEKPAFRQNAINEKYAKKQEEKAKEESGEAKATRGIELAKSLDSKSKTILTKYNDMSTEDREKDIRTRPEAEFEIAAAKYFNDKANGKISDIEDIAKKKELARLEVGSKVSKDTRDLYKLSKTDLYNYITTNENGKKYAEELIKFDNALYEAGLISSLKFKTGLAPSRGGRRSSGTRRASSGRRSSGGKGRAKTSVPATDSTVQAGIASFAKANSAARNAKVSKKSLPSGSNIRGASIKAYKKPTKTTVSQRRTA